MRSWCSAPQSSDVAHPAFSKMFVRTEFLARQKALIAHRRRRAPDEPEVWASHHAVVEGISIGEPEFETDRAKFLGRGREMRAPLAMLEGRALSGTAGTVLDAVFALRYRLQIPAGGTARIAYWTCVAGDRRQLLDLADKHRDPNARTRCATLAWTQAQVQLRHLGMDASQANLFQQLAGHILFADATARASTDNLRRGAAGPAGLWSESISGDLPDRAAARGRRRGSAAGAAAAAGARILGHQAALGGPGHPQRARRLLHPGPAGGPRSGRAHQSGAPAHRGHRHPRQGVRAAR